MEVDKTERSQRDGAKCLPELLGKICSLPQRNGSDFRALPFCSELTILPPREANEDTNIELPCRVVVRTRKWVKK